MHRGKEMLRVWSSNFFYSVFYGTILRVRHQGLYPYPKSTNPNSRPQLRLLDLAVHFTTHPPDLIDSRSGEPLDGAVTQEPRRYLVLATARAEL